MLENDGFHITSIIDEHPCDGHGKAKGESCWSVPAGTDEFRNLRALCGRRIKAGGYNGLISPQSLPARRTSTKKEVRA